MLDSVNKDYDEIYKPGDLIKWSINKDAIGIILFYDMSKNLVDQSVYHFYCFKHQTKHIAYTHELTCVK
mgnify:CR=1 FL=1